MGQKFFPIQTETACRLKWSWSTLYLNSGITRSCHRASESLLTAENFSSFHNTLTKLKDREAMLQGKWPGNGCEYCRDIEAAGGTSDRQFQNTIPNSYSAELDNDNRLTVVQPSVLEVYFNNTCNLSCLYCNESFSSRIMQENKKFGGPLKTTESVIQWNTPQYKNLTPLFWEWLNVGYLNLTRLNIVGGEPFLQPELDKIVEYINENPNMNLELNVITNLNVPAIKIEEFCKKMTSMIQNKKLKRVDILASVDCWGKEQEYIRTGFDCITFEKNVKILLNYPLIRIGFLSTLTSLSIPSMHKLAKKITEWTTKHKIYWYMNLVVPINDHVLTPDIVDITQYDRSIELTRKLMAEGISDSESTIKTFDGIIAKIKATAINYNRIVQLMKYLDDNDVRKGTNWREVFPWLVNEVKDVV